MGRGRAGAAAVACGLAVGAAAGAGPAGAAGAVQQFGAVRLSCDNDGDGFTQAASYIDGVFSFGDGPDVRFAPGGPAAIGLCGDWDGNGTDTPGVRSGNRWYLRNRPRSGPAEVSFGYGFAGTGSLAGDWDGDGRDGVAVVLTDDPTTGRTTWWLRNRPAGGPADRVVSFTPGAWPDGETERRYTAYVMAADLTGDGRDRPTVAVTALREDPSGSELRRTRTYAEDAAGHSEEAVYHQAWDDEIRIKDPYTGRWDIDGLRRPVPVRRVIGPPATVGTPVPAAAPGRQYPPQPMACDNDGDGADAPASYANGVFRFGDGKAVRYGGTGFTAAVCGDWDGNGTDTPGLRAGNRWHLRNRPGGGTADRVVSFGFAGTRSVVGDWDGDGRDGIAVVTTTDSSTGRTAWHLRNTLSNGSAQEVVTFSPGGWPEGAGATVRAGSERLVAAGLMGLRDRPALGFVVDRDGAATTWVTDSGRYFENAPGALPIRVGTWPGDRLAPLMVAGFR